MKNVLLDFGIYVSYYNFIDFPIASDDPPQFELGHFTRVFEGDDLNMTQGFWLYVVEDGVYTP